MNGKLDTIKMQSRNKPILSNANKCRQMNSIKLKTIIIVYLLFLYSVVLAYTHTHTHTFLVEGDWLRTEN